MLVAYCIYDIVCVIVCVVFFFFQAEDGIRDLVRSRGLGDVYKRQHQDRLAFFACRNQVTGQFAGLVEYRIGLRDDVLALFDLSLIHI